MVMGETKANEKIKFPCCLQPTDESLKPAMTSLWELSCLRDDTLLGAEGHLSLTSSNLPT